MGEVWLARHRLLARSAAIKLIRPEILSDGRVDRAAITLGRFEREAQATAALTSPHTIRLFDFGQTGDGTFYYVMMRSTSNLSRSRLSANTIVPVTGGLGTGSFAGGRLNMSA